MNYSLKRLILLVIIVFLMIPGVTNADEKDRKKVFFGAQASFSLLLEDNNLDYTGGVITSSSSVGGFAEWRFTKILSLGLYGYYNHFSHIGTPHSYLKNSYLVNRDGVGNIFNFNLGFGINLPIIESMELFGLFGYGVKTGKILAPSVRMPGGGILQREETKASGNYMVGEFGMRIFFTVKKVIYKFYWSYKIDNLFEDYIYSNVNGSINIGILAAF